MPPEPQYPPQDYAGQQGQQPPLSEPMYDPPDTRWEYETNDIIEEVRETLTGIRWNPEEKKYEIIGEKLCNKKGVYFFLTWLRIVLNRVTYLSNFSKDEVIIRLKTYGRKIIKEVGCRAKEFDIDKNARSRVVLLIDHMLTCALNKPKDDLEREHKGRVETRKTVTQRIEEVGNPEKKAGGGFFG